MRKHFLNVFIPSFLVGMLVTSLIYRMHYTNNKDFIRDEAKDFLSASTNELADNTFEIGRSLVRIANTSKSDAEFNPQLLARSLNGLMDSRTEIDHIRFIDISGQESIRFNRGDRGVYRVQENNLQDKSARPYFVDNMDLEDGEIALSPLNLNKDRGMITTPYTLVVRWVVPLFGIDGSKKGTLVANIDFNLISNRASDRIRFKDGQLLLKSADSAIFMDGQVLYGGPADSIMNFLTGYGQPFDSIIESKNGMLIGEQATEAVKIIDSKLRNIGVERLRTHQANSQVLVWIPGDKLYSRIHENLPYIIILQSFVTIVVAFFSYRWARFRITETITFDELHKSNTLLKVSEKELAAAMLKLEAKVATQEDEIEEAHRLLAALFDSSMHFAGIMKPDGQLINVNRKTLKLTGQKKSDVVGKKIWEFDLFGDREFVKESMSVAIAQAMKGERVSFESIMYDMNGDKRRIAFTLSPLYNEDGEITHLIPEGADITELREKDKQLQSVITQLENRNQQLKEFSHIVSHNVRSPIGNLGLLLSIYEDAENDEERKEIVDKIKMVNQSLLELLEELLETVKILDNSEISTELNSVESAINQARTLLTRQIEESNAEFEIENAATEVYYPKVYLHSLLLNLMSNAIKYRTDERQLKITIKMQVNENEQPQLIFKDNGSGIDMRRHGHKVFGLYKTFHRNKPGKGLGLFMTKTQVESHGGTIQVSSNLNEGTTFTITFPPTPRS